MGPAFGPGGVIGASGAPVVVAMGPGMGETIVVSAVDERALIIMRYCSTVKCISILDVGLCAMMAVFYNPWFAVISPLALCGFWGARTLNPYWLTGYQLFIILGQHRISLWGLLLIAVN